MLYSLIKRLLFVREITVLDIHACVSYIITRMGSPSICHENVQLQVDVILMKKLRLFVLSSIEEHCVHLKSLFSKHTKYLLKIFQQIIQLQRFKKASITLKRVLKNVTKRFNSAQHFLLTKYKLINQGVKTINDPYYNTHQKLIILNPLQKVISTTVTGTHHVWTGKLRGHLRPFWKFLSSTSIILKQVWRRQISISLPITMRLMIWTTIKWIVIPTTQQMLCTVTLITRMYNKCRLPIIIFTALPIPNYNWIML